MSPPRAVLVVFAAALVAAVIMVAVHQNGSSSNASSEQAQSTSLAADPAASQNMGSVGSSHQKKELPSRVYVFIKQTLNGMRRSCGMKKGVNIRKLRVKSWKRQVTDGTTFKVVVQPVFRESMASGKTYTILVNKLPSEKVPEIIKEPVGQPKRTADKFHVLSIEPKMCDLKNPWEDKNGPPRSAKALELSFRSTGHIDPPASQMRFAKLATPTQLASAPASINWRDQFPGSRASRTGNQGSCGSCYAWAATQAFSYRLYKESDGKYDVWPSTQEAMDCTNGCDGGSAYSVYTKMDQDGGTVPRWCDPYASPAAVQSCSSGGSSCSDGSSAVKVSPDSSTIASLNTASAGSVQAAAEQIAYEVATNGPSYMSLYASSALQSHKGNSIFTGDAADTGAGANHAVTVLGYGTDGGVDYWWIQNSWGSGWGEDGIGRIAKGVDAIGIESGGITYVTPKIPSECASSPACQNGGSYQTDCQCHCLFGFSGSDCSTCDRTCSGGNLAGAAYVSDDQQCLCGCQTGYYTQEGQECVTGMKIEGSTDAVVTPSGTSFSISLSNSEGKFVVSGDFYIAVPEGEEAYTAAGWNANGVQSNVCGPTGSNYYCSDMEALQPGWTRTTSFFQNMNPGKYDVYYYQWQGMNEFGGDKGFALGWKLSQQVNIDSCFDSTTHCSTYVGWGCSAMLTSGQTVSQLCAKSCNTC